MAIIWPHLPLQLTNPHGRLFTLTPCILIHLQSSNLSLHIPAPYFYSSCPSTWNIFLLPLLPLLYSTASPLSLVPTSPCQRSTCLERVRFGLKGLSQAIIYYRRDISKLTVHTGTPLVRFNLSFLRKPVSFCLGFYYCTYQILPCFKVNCI